MPPREQAQQCQQTNLKESKADFKSAQPPESVRARMHACVQIHGWEMSVSCNYHTAAMCFQHRLPSVTCL